MRQSHFQTTEDLSQDKDFVRAVELVAIQKGAKAKVEGTKITMVFRHSDQTNRHRFDTVKNQVNEFPGVSVV